MGSNNSNFNPQAPNPMLLLRRSDAEKPCKWLFDGPSPTMTISPYPHALASSSSWRRYRRKKFDQFKRTHKYSARVTPTGNLQPNLWFVTTFHTASSRVFISALTFSLPLIATRSVDFLTQYTENSILLWILYNLIGTFNLSPVSAPLNSESSVYTLW